MLRLAMTIACAVVALAALPAVASAAAPGLGGTTLSESDPTVTNCPVPGDAGTFTYEASGNATGTYAGTFTETGSITVAPYDGRATQRVTAAQIQFTIDSPTGQVSGTKTYIPVGDPNVNTARATCESDWDGNGGSIFIASDDLRYSATIAAADGTTCTASGPASLSLVDNSSVLSDSFSQTFLNDASAPVTCTGGEPEPEPEPEMPMSKEDCMGGGWQAYGFPNQGQCIAWVNHNRP
jgi:hypothetical protein